LNERVAVARTMANDPRIVELSRIRPFGTRYTSTTITYLRRRAVRLRCCLGSWAPTISPQFSFHSIHSQFFTGSEWLRIVVRVPIAVIMNRPPQSFRASVLKRPPPGPAALSSLA